MTCVHRKKNVCYSFPEYYSTIDFTYAWQMCQHSARTCHREQSCRTCREKKKKEMPVRCISRYRRATWRRSPRTSSLSLWSASPFASYRPSRQAVPASGPRSRSVALDSSPLPTSVSLSLSLSLSFSRPSTFVLIPITRSEISRTTSGSRGSRSCVHCTNLTTNRLVPSVSHPPIERPTNLASNHPHVHVRANTYANVLCYVPYRDENTFRGWRRASSVDRPGPYTHSTPRMPSRSPATFSV